MLAIIIRRNDNPSPPLAITACSPLLMPSYKDYKQRKAMTPSSLQRAEGLQCLEGRKLTWLGLKRWWCGNESVRLTLQRLWEKLQYIWGWVIREAAGIGLVLTSQGILNTIFCSSALNLTIPFRSLSISQSKGTVCVCMCTKFYHQLTWVCFCFTLFEITYPDVPVVGESHAGLVFSQFIFA